MKRLFSSLMICVAISSFGQTAETKVKALFILKFIENVSFPEQHDQLILGFLGNSAVSAEVESRLKIKNPSNIVVRNISAKEAGTCHIVFVSASEESSFTPVTKQTNGQPILFITESNLTQKGSGISFINEDNRLHFLVNKNALEARGLKVSNALVVLGKSI